MLLWLLMVRLEARISDLQSILEEPMNCQMGVSSMEDNDKNAPKNLTTVQNVASNPPPATVLRSRQRYLFPL